jgi:rRNA-processing protein EBP2
MGKKNKKQTKTSATVAKSHPQPDGQEKAETLKVTWEEIVAMSDSDDDDQDIGVAVDLNAKARSLRQAIKDGKFNSLLRTSPGRKDDVDIDDDEFEEDVLCGSANEEEAADDGDADRSDDESVEEERVGTGTNNNEDEDVCSDDENESQSSTAEVNGDDLNESDGVAKTLERDEDTGNNANSEEENQEDVEEKDGNANSKRIFAEKPETSKALAVVTAELAASHSRLSWAETFVVVPPTPLPFGENGNPELNPLDIHDDLKREVAFYNTALEAVHQARSLCKEANIPFSRPEDFFAEMVKTDGMFHLNCRFKHNYWVKAI